MPVVALVLGVVVGCAVTAGWLGHRGGLRSRAGLTTFDTLHTANLAAPSLREGLTADGAQRAVHHLRALLPASAVALTDLSRTLAVDGSSHEHAWDSVAYATDVLEGGESTIIRARALACPASDCPIRAVVACPIVDGDAVVGALVAYSQETASASLVRAMEEVARWVSGQVALASADAQRRQLMAAELRALRAQISPHFIYNSLTAIASFTRTDPDRARDLLLEFADFTRYALRRGGEFATVADELRNTERYLVLEQARFGDRLSVSLRVAPEALTTALPFLVVQPLVENAVRHGCEGHLTGVTVSITVSDEGGDSMIVVEDDGAGCDPEVIRAALQQGGLASGSGSIGLGNVDARLRHYFGDQFGLVIETAPGAGTKVSFRVPKYAPGVHS